MKLNKLTKFPRCYHAIFKDGILLDRHVSESSNDVCDALFLDGTSLRTILSNCLLLFTEERTTSLPERRAIRRWTLFRSVAKPTTSEPDDFHITDSDQPGTLAELDPETEIAS